MHFEGHLSPLVIRVCSQAAASAAKVAEKLKEPAEDTNAEPLVIVQTPAINGACEETGQPASVSAKPGEQPESQHPANQQHSSDSGHVGDAVASSTAPTTTARVTESGPSPVESAPAGETPARAQSREAAAEASSYADRSSPAERPSVSRPGALPPILTRRPSQPNGDEAGAPAEAPADASKLRSRFKSVAAEEDAPPVSGDGWAVRGGPSGEGVGRGAGVRQARVVRRNTHVRRRTRARPACPWRAMGVVAGALVGPHEAAARTGGSVPC